MICEVSRLRINSGTKKIEDEYELTETYPFFFWRECECCHDKVKREIMWSLHVLVPSNYYTYPYNKHILCTRCFPTREAVHKYYVYQTKGR